MIHEDDRQAPVSPRATVDAIGEDELPYRYEAARGDLVASDPSGGSIAWRARPNGQPVWKVCTIPGSDDCLAFLEYWARTGYGSRNLLRFRSDGSIAWRAEQPEGDHDRYTGMGSTAEGLEAWSSSGYQVRLDPDTGRILSRTFTK
jgi:hypothetical protein